MPTAVRIYWINKYRVNQFKERKLPLISSKGTSYINTGKFPFQCLFESQRKKELVRGASESCNVVLTKFYSSLQNRRYFVSQAINGKREAAHLNSAGQISTAIVRVYTE